ncbi:MAG: transposase family protein [Pirellula sp.]|nr:transposase family protein [Pirellula sp.]
MKDIGKGSLSLTGVHGMVAKLSLVECMAAVEDPRVDRTKAHDLQDILVLAVPVVLAVLCGADGSEDIEFFADGGGDYVLARNRGQSPGDSVRISHHEMAW